jgi:hypothetical protein
LFLERLQKAFDLGGLNFFGELASLADPPCWYALLTTARRIDWVVYAKNESLRVCRRPST